MFHVSLQRQEVTDVARTNIRKREESMTNSCAALEKKATEERG